MSRARPSSNDPGRPSLTREHFDAVLFDLDGVITDTARLHAACWKRMLN